MRDTKKTNTKKTNIKKTKKWITEIIEISLLLVAFGIVIEILFGSVAPLGSGIIMNLIGLLGTLGDNGFIGLVALGIVVYIFRRSNVFA
ncbi:MAG: hypothetical protein JXA81_05345 [Sedimentisphaerales bacterium]|nr:hypothetical protein [Sedimentisphaerales bacterium]